MNRRLFIAGAFSAIVLPTLSFAGTGFSFRRPITGKPPIRRAGGVLTSFTPDTTLGNLQVELQGEVLMSWWGYQFMVNPPFPVAFRLTQNGITYRKSLTSESASADAGLWQFFGVGSANAQGAGDPEDLDCLDELNGTGDTNPLNGPGSLNFSSASGSLGGGTSNLNFSGGGDEPGDFNGFINRFKPTNNLGGDSPTLTTTTLILKGKVPGSFAEVHTKEELTSYTRDRISNGGLMGSVLGVGAAAAALSQLGKGGSTDVVNANIGGGKLKVTVDNDGNGGKVTWGATW